MRTPVFAYLLVLAIVGVAAYGYWEGTPQDTVNAVRKGNVDQFRKAVRRDPAAVHTKVYPQAFERQSDRDKHRVRTGESPWEGRYLIHDAVQRGIDPIPMLDALAEAGADLRVRLRGRTLLHLAALDGNDAVVAWLITRGADLNAQNDCAVPCAQRGQTPLHDARDGTTTSLLLARGAAIEARSANGQTALHQAASDGGLGNAFVLCRHGADVSASDAAGKTPAHLADAFVAASNAAQGATDERRQLARWLQPRGGCAIVAEAARKAGAPVSEDEGRKVYAETVMKPMRAADAQRK